MEQGIAARWEERWVAGVQSGGRRRTGPGVQSGDMRVVVQEVQQVKEMRGAENTVKRE